jgi:hypothetical protein
MTTDSGPGAAAAGGGNAAASGAAVPYVDAMSLSGADEQVYEAVVTLENTGQPASRAALAAATGIEQAALDARLRDLTDRRLITRGGSGADSVYAPARRDWSAAPDTAGGQLAG